jgi:hypothetical protein
MVMLTAQCEMHAPGVFMSRVDEAVSANTRSIVSTPQGRVGAHPAGIAATFTGASGLEYTCILKPPPHVWFLSPVQGFLHSEVGASVGGTMFV